MGLSGGGCTSELGAAVIPAAWWARPAPDPGPTGPAELVSEVRGQSESLSLT